MATVYKWLSATETRIGESASIPLSTPIEYMMNGVNQSFIKSVDIPAHYTAISSISFVYRSKTTASGNLYLKFATSYVSTTSGATFTEDVDSLTAYAASSADGARINITVPAAAYSSLTSMAEGYTLFIAAIRDASNALDTYESDLDALGFLIAFTTDTTDPVDGAYCSQTDLERRLTTATLAQLTSETANATTVDSTIAQTLITTACGTIDSYCGNSYTVPFTTVPVIIKNLAVDLACCFAFQRKTFNVGMPESWKTVYKDALKMLEDIAAGAVDLGSSVSALTGGKLESNSARIDFYDEDNSEYNF